MSMDHIIVWDLETVPDIDAVARVHNLDPSDTDAVLATLGEKFPKHPYHKIICIGALIAKKAPTGWQVTSKGAPHCGQRSEAELIQKFTAKISELKPRLVTFNGNSFDLPVLRYRALLHRISCPGLSAQPYFNRYSSEAIDLCDVLASFGNAKATLHEISRVLGFAGKASGIAGSDVARLFLEGKISEISSYCLEDVLNTYRIWLAYELFCGRLTEEQYKFSDECSLDGTSA